MGLLVKGKRAVTISSISLLCLFLISMTIPFYFTYRLPITDPFLGVSDPGSINSASVLNPYTWWGDDFSSTNGWMEMFLMVSGMVFHPGFLLMVGLRGILPCVWSFPAFLIFLFGMAQFVRGKFRKAKVKGLIATGMSLPLGFVIINGGKAIGPGFVLTLCCFACLAGLAYWCEKAEGKRTNLPPTGIGYRSARGAADSPSSPD